MIEKALRGTINLIRILIIKIRCGSKVNIYPIQPMRIKSQLMIQKRIKQVIIGRNLKLETDAKIRVIEGGSLIIGNNCFINCGSYITVLGRTQIGDNCMIGPNVLVFDHDHDFRAEGGIAEGRIVIGDIVIGDGVWIGGNTSILRGTNIGDNAVIAAGSVIKGNIPANSIVVQKRTSKISEYCKK